MKFLLILQMIFLILWYAVPGMALCPAFLVFLPTFIIFTILGVFVGVFVLGCLIASRA